ncbi:MAG: hypothetical protein M3457_04185 [Chloroflexota bacterium]|nr:hypothetical protein [Chloroflexota bacterium]
MTAALRGAYISSPQPVMPDFSWNGWGRLSQRPLWGAYVRERFVADDGVPT